MKIRSMVGEPSTGLVTAREIQPRSNLRKFNSTKGLGGEGCLTVKDSTKRPMVRVLLLRRFLHGPLQERPEAWGGC
jgi:hypothetical protein